MSSTMTTPGVAEWLRQARVLAPQQAGSLQVFGLQHDFAHGPDYQTLDEALAAGTLSVTEISDAGRVSTLQVANKSGFRVLLVAGEQLVGAKQNRVLNTSLMVEPEAEIPVPVSCVEARRWAYQSRAFISSGSASHSRLRAKMTQQVSHCYDVGGYAGSDQHAVWAEVSEKLERMGSHSDSCALEQTYSDYRARLDQEFSHLQVPEGCQGVAFALNGKIVGVDLFDRHETLTKLWPKLLRSYSIDAMELPQAPGSAIETAAVQRWLNQAADLPAKSFPAAGLGQDVRLESGPVVGSSLVVDDHPIHVQLFALPA
jgi:hypothetical protein